MNAQVRSRALKAAFLVVFLDMLGFGVLIPVVRDLTQAIVANSGLGYPGPEVFMGILMASYSGAQMLGAPFWGSMSDRFGRKLVFIISIVGNIFSYGIWISAHTYWPFLAGRVLSGITGGNISIAQAVIADHTTPEERPRAMGLLGACIGMGFVLGPFIGILLLGVSIPPHGLLIKINPFWQLGGLCLLLSVVALIMISFSQFNPHSSEPRPIHRVRFFLIMRWNGQSIYLTQLCAQIMFVTFEVLLAWILQKQYRFGLHETYYFFGIQGILLALVQGGLYRRFEKMRPPAFWIQRSLVVSAICVGLLPWAGYLDQSVRLGILFLLLGILTLALGFGQPSLNAYASIHAPGNQQGQAMGTMQGIAAFARFSVPIAATGLYAWWLPLPFLAAGIICFLGWLNFRRREQ
jgi:MFS transporter, DHA1 family, tetracycline resistance protein